MRKVHRPLRIAFFGSDAFSVHSLKRLLQLQQNQPTKVAAIDVYTRSIKPSGRSLKQLVDVPIGMYAQQNNVDVFRVDTSQQIADMALPRDYHLAVAVSYGKLIPGRLLAALPFGGLNVHPSMLPRYSGSSPIQYALMNDCKTTGVTVQTLHPTKFDCGDLIAQTANVPIRSDDDFKSLQDKLGLLGADLLAEVISKGLFVDPKPITNNEVYSLAPKLTPKCYLADWNTITARQAKRLCDALGSLHTYKEVRFKRKRKLVEDHYKVILQDVKEAWGLSALVASTMLDPGDFSLCGNSLLVKTLDGFITVGALKLQYCNSESAPQFIANLEKRCGDTSNTFITNKP